MVVGLVVFWGTPDSETGGASDSFACSGVPFPPAGLSYPTLMRGFVDWSYCMCWVDIPGRPAVFSLGGA